MNVGDSGNHRIVLRNELVDTYQKSIEPWTPTTLTTYIDLTGLS